MTAALFLAHPGALDGLAPGSAYALEGTEARHAGVVQRRRAGERVDVADGAGLRLECRITAVEPGRVGLEVLHVRREEPPAVPVRLVQALAKGDRDELAIEAATEVGVDGVIPWQAQRSVVVWRGDRAAKSRAKWCATVRQATKQSRRAHEPTVADAVDTRGLVALVRAAVADGGCALVLHEEAQTPLYSVELPTRGEILLVVGPEGGIDEGEVEALEAAGARTVRLGPHVLRTSTAGPVALALVLSRLGRWGAPGAGGGPQVAGLA